MKQTRRRFYDRQAVNASAVLTPLDGAGSPLSVSVRDLSPGGARLVSPASLPVGSVWRMEFAARKSGEHHGVFLVRSCLCRHENEHEAGGQFIADPAMMEAAGVSTESHSASVREFHDQHAKAPWDLSFNLVAREAITLSRLSAMSVSVTQDLTLAESAFDCTLDIGGRLLASQARVIGGTTHALKGATIGELGAENGRPTTLVLGGTLATAAIVSAAATHLEPMKQAVRETQERIDRLREKAEMDHSERELLTVLLTELDEARERCKRIETNSRTLQSWETSRRSYRLEAVRMIHPGSVVTAGSSRMVFTRALAGPVVLDMGVKGELEVITGSAGPCSLIDFATPVRLAA